MRISYNLKLEQSQKLIMTPELQQAINLLQLSVSIKSHLREMINAENTYRPMSDQKLVELLARRDVLLSRRTVVKYREEIGIPSSTRRKRI
ncbi:MAG: RNA polymerase sigma-54 factor [Syntrophomonadaceae bacterium]|nr:RNA polymerase sigma-54 factor [Bacillota bacterium]